MARGSHGSPPLSPSITENKGFFTAQAWRDPAFGQNARPGARDFMGADGQKAETGGIGRPGAPPGQVGSAGHGGAGGL
ncbi:hypothetical protein LNKW23_15470 [Paralimibaculum aggregatum]|uniref:Uncharacterized protein n=1 Tax=Paralimibaculum aggregatum TaxID=3036245 RepID=A0ABQ6LNY7_9RHOB|nr:hypothetical protein LNKW23_15470 [Limibaculum sp. NKW23]